MTTCAAVIKAIAPARTINSASGAITSSATAPSAAATPAARCHRANPPRAARCGARREKWFAM